MRRPRLSGRLGAGRAKIAAGLMAQLEKMLKDPSEAPRRAFDELVTRLQTDINRAYGIESGNVMRMTCGKM